MSFLSSVKSNLVEPSTYYFIKSEDVANGFINIVSNTTVAIPQNAIRELPSSSGSSSAFLAVPKEYLKNINAEEDLICSIRIVRKALNPGVQFGAHPDIISSNVPLKQLLSGRSVLSNADLCLSMISCGNPCIKNKEELCLLKHGCRVPIFEDKRAFEKLNKAFQWLIFRRYTSEDSHFVLESSDGSVKIHISLCMSQALHEKLNNSYVCMFDAKK